MRREKAVQGILTKWASGEMSLSNGCMSLLNLFWQCRTDLKAHVIIPLGIDISNQSRGSPGRKAWSKRDMWLKSPATLQTPAIASSFTDSHTSSEVQWSMRIFKAVWKWKQWCHLLWTNLKQPDIIHRINTRKNLFSNIDKVIIRAGVYRFPSEEFLMSFPLLLQKITSYLLHAMKLGIPVLICHV